MLPSLLLRHFRPRNPALSEATSAQPRIHWAGETDPARKLELEAKFEAMRARNWITERMVEQYQKHWQLPSREAGALAACWPKLERSIH